MEGGEGEFSVLRLNSKDGVFYGNWFEANVYQKPDSLVVILSEI